MLKAIAIDDEPLALEVIKSHAKHVQIDLVQVFTNPVEALNWLKKNEVDLLFLDINMRDVNGIEFVQSINNCPAVIYITAYPDYAVKSYELNAIDYLLKPIKLARFIQAVDKVRFLNDKEKKSLFFKEGHQHIKLKLSDILFLESDKNYLDVYTLEEKHILRKTLKEMKELLDQNSFIQVHRSFIVNKEMIRQVEPNRIKLLNGSEIPLSSSYRDEVYKRIGIN